MGGDARLSLPQLGRGGTLLLHGLMQHRRLFVGAAQPLACRKPTHREGPGEKYGHVDAQTARVY